ncbi:ethyl tert-butyl ether degradation protein EthD [Leifsonia sp. Leaf325]|nr:EthD family reductase [Leifsonia sp. Leaf325]KQQ94593.1 ethyl tert-butyl ether degradation protein EthD [Leifsonia sp. Leaf325]
MPTKITVLYDNPTDPVEFERAYEANQLVELARKMPGLERFETSKIWPKEDGTPTPAYRQIDMYFSDYASASAAVTTAEAGALFPALGEVATGGVKFMFMDVEESELNAAASNRGAGAA